MFATWEPANEGNIFIKCELNCTKILKIFEKFEKSDCPTITHFSARALGEILKVG